jgi:tRNA threonylcarbamoyladenosine biosynthesis protein TsaB
MLGLAIESSGRAASAALWRSVDVGVGRLVDASLPPETGKADQLITVVESLLGDEGLSYADLDVIAVNRGPGSFTGIRSAVALARGLALATGLPVLGVTSHEVLAATLVRDRRDEQRDRPFVIALDARRGEVYAQSFSKHGTALGEIVARAPAAIADDLKTDPWLLAGDGASLVIQALDAHAKVEMIKTKPIESTAVAMAASERLSAGGVPSSGDQLKPLYVRAPDAVPPAPLVSRSDDLEVLA